MYQIVLKNDKVFECDENTTIFQAAKNAGIHLEHSCLTARCRSCVVKVQSGSTENLEEELVLSDEEKKDNFILSCNAKPTSDLKLDIEDLGNVKIFDKKIVPAKINSIEKLTEDVIKVLLRLPPNANFNFNAGQYVNLIKGAINRSYSIASSPTNGSQLEFFIKKYENGLMSKYWFEEAKINDLLRVEGPLGSFFLRESNKKNIVFLATGTGVAPIKSILEDIALNNTQLIEEKNFWVFVGARYQNDLFWNLKLKNVKFIETLSRPEENWKGEKGYVQDIVLKQNINLNDAQVYACGSNQMIQAAKKLLISNLLEENHFFSDAFVQTN